VGNGYTQFLYSCPVSNMVAPILWSVSTALGLLIGCIVYIATLNSDVRRLVHASYGLFALSFIFYGASLFSFMISVRVSNKLTRKCCTGYCFCIWFFGCFEVTSVLSGILTGAIMDGTIPQQYYSYGFPGFFSVLIGIPTVYGALLAFGIPRVAVMGCLGRRKVKKDEDAHDESVNGPRHDFHEHRESAPLLSTTDATRRGPAAQAAVPPSYFPAPHNGPAVNYQAAAPAPQYIVGETGQMYNK